jgi:electron transport complex protein RnfB
MPHAMEGRPSNERVDAIDALLPQTQCTRCGFQGCRPYAEALALGTTALNRCPPGGSATIQALAQLLARPALPLDPACGAETPQRVAFIDEERCIGCARCLPPCPVDAIVGAQRYTHTVLDALCTGCELCIAPCPVDCITMIPRPATAPPAPAADANRAGWHAHQDRARRRAAARAARIAERKRTPSI